MILDRQGRLVWFSPVTEGKPFDFNAQSDQDRPVLTWWQGTVTGAHGLGVGEIADSSYKTITTVTAGDGLVTDLHELNSDLVGHGADHCLRDDDCQPVVRGSEAQRARCLSATRRRSTWRPERSCSTGEAWITCHCRRASRPAGEPKGTFDYFHINSVAEMDDGNLLISGRNTWALYKVDRSSGKVIWRLNGKRSNFSVSQRHASTGSTTRGQNGHSGLTRVRQRGAQEGAPVPRPVADRSTPTRCTSSLVQAYIHPARFLSNTLGNVQLLEDGRVFIGWGDQPYFSEFAPDGTLLLDGQLPVGVRSYRAFAANWVGQPAEPPRVVAKANPAGGFVVYASWNGATEIDKWTILAGSHKSSLTPGRLAALGRLRDADRRQLVRALTSPSSRPTATERNWGAQRSCRPERDNSHVTDNAQTAGRLPKRL